MDQTDLLPIISELSDEISDLTTTLSPLLNAPLSTTSSKLPLLDKAKLHVLAAYAIESLLFSSLRLADVDAKQHPVFTELQRVQQYFAKINKAEAGPEKRAQVLDKRAAGRFIKHALSGNEQLDKEKAEGAATKGRQSARLLAGLEQHITAQSQAAAVDEHGSDEEHASASNVSGIPSSDGPLAEGRRLYLGNFPLTATKEMVKTLFNKSGFDIEGCDIRVKKKRNKTVGHAFVDLASTIEAERAMSALSTFHLLDQQVWVSLATGSASREAGPLGNRKRAAANEGDGNANDQKASPEAKLSAKARKKQKKLEKQQQQQQ